MSDLPGTHPWVVLLSAYQADDAVHARHFSTKVNKTLIILHQQLLTVMTAKTYRSAEGDEAADHHQLY